MLGFKILQGGDHEEQNQLFPDRVGEGVNVGSLINFHIGERKGKYKIKWPILTNRDH